jgi:hypothetical protein
MENLNFESEMGKKVNPAEKENKIEFDGPNLRIINFAKKELSMLFGFGLRSIDTDAELMAEINRHFFENEGVMNNKIVEWKNALSDVNKDAAQVEDILAKNLAKQIYDFVVLESKIRDRYNN